MSRVFACSDIHFGHENIIRYCSRPFKSAVDMDSYIIDEWNRRVDVGDVVYFLGDFAMGHGVDDGFIADKLSFLNGQIAVVLGNHDRPARKFGVSGLAQVVKDYGLDRKVEILSDIHEEHIDGQMFVMCHYPMNDWNGKFKGWVHLHGHQHNGFSSSKAREQAAKKRYDIGVDMYGGPVQISGDCRFLNDPKGWNK